jgi:type I restriction enzyme, S subunit
MIVNERLLPDGWAETSLGSVHLDLGRGLDPSRTPNETFELYSVPSYERCTPEIIKGREIGSSKQIIVPRTVLLCKINPRINRVWVTGNHSPYRKIASTEWIPFFQLAGLEPRYLAYFLRQNVVRDFLAGEASGVGGSLMRVRAATLRDFVFHVAPQSEQTRIADALDELFSDLDEGVAALKRVQEKLKLYRASILKAAVEGDQTAEWRAQHPDTEPASELLKRILFERRRRWEEEQLHKFKEKGQEPPRNWKTRYKEPAQPDTSELPPLREGWCWSCGDAVFSFITSGSRGWARYYAEEGSLFIRMGNLDHDSIRLSLTQKQHVKPPAGSEGLRTRVEPCDILISITADVGMVALVPGDIEPAYVNQHIALARPMFPELGSFVAWYLACPSGGQTRLRDLQRGATKVGLGLDDIRNVAIPLPPLTEQQVIVEAVEEQLSAIDHLEAEIANKLRSGQALRQAILRHAFTGQLVPQDPNDEPASELLKRIAAEREARAKEIAATRRATKSGKAPYAPRSRRPKKKRAKDN